MFDLKRTITTAQSAICLALLALPAGGSGCGASDSAADETGSGLAGSGGGASAGAAGVAGASGATSSAPFSDAKLPLPWHGPWVYLHCGGDTELFARELLACTETVEGGCVLRLCDKADDPPKRADIGTVSASTPHGEVKAGTASFVAKLPDACKPGEQVTIAAEGGALKGFSEALTVPEKAEFKLPLPDALSRTQAAVFTWAPVKTTVAVTVRPNYAPDDALTCYADGAAGKLQIPGALLGKLYDHTHADPGASFHLQSLVAKSRPGDPVLLIVANGMDGGSTTLPFKLAGISSAAATARRRGLCSSYVNINALLCERAPPLLAERQRALARLPRGRSERKRTRDEYTFDFCGIRASCHGWRGVLGGGQSTGAGGEGLRHRIPHAPRGSPRACLQRRALLDRISSRAHSC